STPTFPNASATSGKVIKSDGTNWVASTETYAAPGTSGNVMTSDGTNWTSAESVGNAYFIQTVAGNPADATTYFLQQSITTINNTASGNAATRYYITRAGTIKKVYGVVTCTTGSSNATTIALRLNNTTDTNVTTSLNLSASPATFNNTALSITVAAGDYIEFKLICPT